MAGSPWAYRFRRTSVTEFGVAPTVPSAGVGAAGVRPGCQSNTAGALPWRSIPGARSPTTRTNQRLPSGYFSTMSLSASLTRGSSDLPNALTARRRMA